MVNSVEQERWCVWGFFARFTSAFRHLSLRCFCVKETGVTPETPEGSDHNCIRLFMFPSALQPWLTEAQDSIKGTFLLKLQTLNPLPPRPHFPLLAAALQLVSFFLPF